MTKRALLGQLADVDIRLLRIFRVVTEAGGISAAELELNIGRSTISRHIKELEQRLGVTLCHRGRGGFALTEEGRQIYQATLRLIASLDEFRAEVAGVHERMSGQLTIALFDKTVTHPDCHISRALGQFSDLAPAVTINLYVESINDIEKGVMDGRFHLGVIPEHRPSASLSYYPLYREQMYLYCGRQHPLYKRVDSGIDAAEIRACPYAGLGYHSPNMKVGRSLGMERSANAYDQEGIATLIMSGRYLGHLPDHYARSFVAEGRIRALAVDTFRYDCEFSAILRRAPRPSRVVAAFVDCLRRTHGEFAR